MTSTRMGPKFLEMESRELRRQQRKEFKSGNAPAIHVLHAHYDVAALVQEGAEEGNDVGRVALVHNLQLADDLLADLGLGLDADDLESQQAQRREAGDEPCGP
jgi:hypothetical protein